MPSGFWVTLVLCTVLPLLLFLVLTVVILRWVARRNESQERRRLAVENRKITVPMQLGAYERLALLLERISPESMVVRVTAAGLTASHYEAALLESLREEWNHNLSQQIYVTAEAWSHAQHARGQVAQLIRLCKGKVHDDSPASELIGMILATLTELPQHPTRPALEILRREVEALF